MKDVRIKKVENGYILYKKHFSGTNTYVTNNYNYLLEELKRYFNE